MTGLYRIVDFSPVILTDLMSNLQGLKDDYALYPVVSMEFVNIFVFCLKQYLWSEFELISEQVSAVLFSLLVYKFINFIF